MENTEQQQPLPQESQSHKKILMIILVVGIIMLVTGAIVWYNVSKSKGESELRAPLDSDSDLLSDEEEKKLGTDPQNEDTDSDGLTDYLEVQLQTDPKNAHTLSPNRFDIDVMAEKQRQQEQLDRQERLQKLKQQN